jgi:hypothetical protein
MFAPCSHPYPGACMVRPCRRFGWLKELIDGGFRCQTPHRAPCEERSVRRTSRAPVSWRVAYACPSARSLAARLGLG